MLIFNINWMAEVRKSKDFVKIRKNTHKNDKYFKDYPEITENPRKS